MARVNEIAPLVPFEASARTRWRLGEMIGRSPAMERLFLQMRYLSNHLRVALIEGEGGTGKLLAARTLHTLATRHVEGFVPCTAAAYFSGQCEGSLAEARGGTLYLTRLHELDTPGQAKLLELLEWHQHQHTRNVLGDAPKQILVSSEQPLRALVLHGRMRADLSYHLSSVRLQLPALRDRREDIPLLAESFLEQFGRQHGKPLRGMGPGVLQHLLAHNWPGNLRELRTTISGAALLCEGQWIRMMDLPLLSAQAAREVASAGSRAPLPMARPAALPLAASTGAGGSEDEDPNLDRAIMRHIRKVMASVGGNKLRSARLLGISRSTLYRLLEADGMGERKGAPAAD
jgi:DNA-binding NtrC family response regulator